MKMKKNLLLFLLLIGYSFSSNAQTVYAYRVSFKNKNFGMTFSDSLSFLTQKSLDRRNKQGIKLDYFDLPITQAYIDSVVVKGIAFRVKNRSKWFNQIIILTKTNNMAPVVALPFVDNVKLVGKYANGWGQRKKNTSIEPNPKETVIISEVKKERGDPSYYGFSFNQIKQTNTDYLHDLGFKGEGKEVAVIDMGFTKVFNLTAFDSTRLQGRFKDQWNFVRDTLNIDSFTSGITHGTDALSLIATNMPGTYVGSAPNCNISMYMSEDLYYESPIEEDNWVSAAERADSLGIDLINTSLGYFIFDTDFSTDNYTYTNDFDGKKTLIARGHNMAVSRGIFCVSAMGNMGAQPWKYLITPADADSTYSVGALDSSGSFLSSMGSSFGPSSDGQIKPDGLGCGVRVMLIANGSGMPGISGGTSFSAPLIAGGIVCLMQALPNLPIWEIRKLVQQSSSRFTTPSDSMGYGVPNFKIAFETGKVLGLQNIKMGNANDYILYPNPSIGNNMYINYTKGNLYNSSIEIINIEGQIVSKQLISNNRFTISDLKKGIYYARISNKNELIVKCILID
jgi:serine protease AprX